MFVITFGIKASFTKVKVRTLFALESWSRDRTPTTLSTTAIACHSRMITRNQFHFTDQTSPITLHWKIDSKVTAIGTDRGDYPNGGMIDTPPFIESVTAKEISLTKMVDVISSMSE